MDWYRRAEEYDLWFSWDTAPERDFVLGASARWGIPRPRRILEPMCGSGRLLRTMPGWAVGLDRVPEMTRLAARDNPVVRADAARPPFRDGVFDLAFNLIDSFRHLRTRDEAFQHLRRTARALRRGAVYVLGFEINGDLPPDTHRDAWGAEHDGRAVHGFVEGLGDLDPERRAETMRVRYAIDGREREYLYRVRTYTRRQVEDLVDEEGSFEIAAAYDVDDRRFDLDAAVELCEVGGSAVLVLRREA